MKLRKKQSYHYCKTIIQQHSSTFYQAFKHLPAEDSKAVNAIYAFCRIADDIADVNADALMLDNLQTSFLNFIAGERRQDVFWPALADVFDRYEMSSAPFLAQLQGQRMDIEGWHSQSMDDLLNYCYYVAGTVGEMLLPILADQTTEELQVNAKELGNAMQITNILRDIGSDLRMDRIYIPQELLDKHKYSAEQLRQRKITSEFISLVEDLMHQAEIRYDSLLYYLPGYKNQAQLPLKAACLYYKAILDAVRRNEYDVFSRRIYVTDEQKKDLYKQLA